MIRIIIDFVLQRHMKTNRTGKHQHKKTEIYIYIYMYGTCSVATYVWSYIEIHFSSITNIIDITSTYILERHCNLIKIGSFRSFVEVMSDS